MRDFQAIPNDRLRAASQNHGRSIALEQIAKAEAATWREKYEALVALADPVYAERDRYRMAFRVLFWANVAAFVVSGLIALGRVL